MKRESISLVKHAENLEGNEDPLERVVPCKKSPSFRENPRVSTSFHQFPPVSPAPTPRAPSHLAPPWPPPKRRVPQVSRPWRREQQIGPRRLMSFLFGWMCGVVSLCWFALITEAFYMFGEIALGRTWFCIMEIRLESAMPSAFYIDPWQSWVSSMATFLTLEPQTSSRATGPTQDTPHKKLFSSVFG